MTDCCCDPHETVKLKNPFYKNEVFVDSGIASLMSEIWKMGIDTIQSCEDWQDGAIYIHFGDIHDLERFVEIVGKDKTLRRFICEETDSEQDWQFQLGVPFFDGSDPILSFAVFIPKDQYDKVLRCFEVEEAVNDQRRVSC